MIVFYIFLILLILYIVVFRLDLTPDPLPKDNHMDFRRNGEFRILQLSDIHLMFPFGKKFRKDTDTIRELVKDNKPDLVVITGDIFLSPLNFIILDCIAMVMEDLKVQWSVTFGNHDSFIGLSRRRLIKRLVRYSNCKNTFCSEYPSRSNTLIRIFDHSGTPSFAVILIDTGSFSLNRETLRIVHGGINDHLVEWYEESLMDSGASSNLIFCHYPVPEMVQLYLNNEYVGTAGKIPSVVYNSDVMLYEAARRNGAKGIFFAHDHRNDFSGFTGGVLLAYCRHTGSDIHKSSGSTPGGRLVILRNKGMTVETSITEIKQ